MTKRAGKAVELVPDSGIPKLLPVQWMDEISDGVYILDSEWRFTYLNRRALEFFGRESSELLGQILWEIFPTKIGSRFEEEYRRAIREAVSVNVTVQSVARPGRWVELRAHPIDGGLVVLFLDVTERELALSALHKSEGQLRIIVDGAPTLISYIDRNYRYQLANKTYEQWFGRPQKEIVGSTVREVVGERVWQIIGPKLARAEQGETVSFEAEALYPAGPGWIHATYTPHVDSTGVVIGVMILVADISAQKRIEQELRDGEAYHRLLFDAVGVGNSELDADTGRFLRVNRRYCEMFGYSEQEFLNGLTVFDITHPEDRDKTDRALKSIVNGETEQYQLEKRCVRKDGSPMWGCLTVTCLKRTDGRIAHLIGVVQDITERKVAEEELRKTAEELIQINEVAPVALWVSRDPMCAVITGNSMAQRLYESEPGENMSSGPARSIGDERAKNSNQRRFFDGSGRAMSTSELPMQQAVLRNAEVRDQLVTFQQPSGHILTMFGSAVPLRNQDGGVRGCVAAFMDVTARVEAERALRESEERLRLAVTAAGVGYWSWNVESDSYVMDETCARMFRVEEAGSLEKIRSAVCAEDLSQVEHAIDVARTSSQPFRAEFRVSDGAGSWRWLACLGDVRWDDTGRPERMFGVTVDTTERKQAEQMLKDADRRKDEFLATLAHELRNPLAPISNSLEIWPRFEKDPVQAARIREMMGRQVKQLKRLIDDLLDVSRISRGKIQLRTEKTELSTILTGAIEAIRPIVDTYRHRLEVEFPNYPVIIDGDIGRLTQVFGNLIHNAAKYTEPGGLIRISADAHDGRAFVRVRDNGSGIPQEMLESIFDAFTQVNVSLDRAQGGLGIGLTLVKNLVEMHGGTVFATSEGPGLGSEFVVTLPLVTEQRKDAPRELGQKDKQFHGVRNLARRRVLVVDDVKPSADTLAMMLEELGQEARVAYDGRSALCLADEFEPDVVFSDIAMPGMDGYGLARQLRTKTGKSPLLVALTGYGQERDRLRAYEAGFSHHLVKPTDLEALRELLTRA